MSLNLAEKRFLTKELDFLEGIKGTKMYNILIWRVRISQTLYFFCDGPFRFFSCHFPFLFLNLRPFILATFCSSDPFLGVAAC